MKTPKVKKRAISTRSRAARRGASPPPTKLSGKTTTIEETEYKPWLHAAQNAGISKKKKTKQLTRQQKVRQQRAMEKADAVVNKLERKVADSKARSKKLQERSKDWEELDVGVEVKITAVSVPVVDAGVEETKSTPMEDVEALDYKATNLTQGEGSSDSQAKLGAPPKDVMDAEITDEIT